MNSIVIGFANEDIVESQSAEQLRVFELEAIIRSMLSELQGAANLLVAPESQKRPVVAACQISQAIAIGRRAFGGQQ